MNRDYMNMDSVEQYGTPRTTNPQYQKKLKGEGVITYRSVGWLESQAHQEVRLLALVMRYLGYEGRGFYTVCLKNSCATFYTPQGSVIRCIKTSQECVMFHNGIKINNKVTIKRRESCLN